MTAPKSGHSLKHCADFVAFQVIYSAGWSALGGYGQKALALFHRLGVSRRHSGVFLA
jgi:hypothetical protein